MGPLTRRDALKYIGLGFGGAAIAPSALLSACRKAASDPTYAYQSFSAPQAASLRLIQDMILPKTEGSPSASEVGSVEFADAYVTHAYEAADKARLLHQLDRFAARLKDEQGADLDDATPEQVEAMFKTYFVDYEAPVAAKSATVMIEGNEVAAPDRAGIDDGEASAGETKLGENLNTHEQVEAPVPQYGDDGMEINAMLKGLRGMTLESYFQSEYVGEEVLNYAEVPGKWIGQMPLSDLPRANRSWSL